MTEKTWEEMSWQERHDLVYQSRKKLATGWTKEEMEETRRFNQTHKSGKLIFRSAETGWRLARLIWLQDNHPQLEFQMFQDNTLDSHLKMIKLTAERVYGETVTRLAKESGVTDLIGRGDWIRGESLMEQCRLRAQETVMREVIQKL